MAQYLLNPAKNGGLTQGNASGLDLSSNYFYGPSLCSGCVFGLGGLYREGFGESTDYHSLQITLRRNMTKHLSYGLAYTYGKLMGLNEGNSSATAATALWKAPSSRISSATGGRLSADSRNWRRSITFTKLPTWDRS